MPPSTHLRIVSTLTLNFFNHLHELCIAIVGMPILCAISDLRLLFRDIVYFRVFLAIEVELCILMMSRMYSIYRELLVNEVRCVAIFKLCILTRQYFIGDHGNYVSYIGYGRSLTLVGHDIALNLS